MSIPLAVRLVVLVAVVQSVPGIAGAGSFFLTGHDPDFIFDDTFGLEVVDRDRFDLSLAGRGQVDEGGVATPTPSTTPTVTASLIPTLTEATATPTQASPSPTPRALDHFKCYRVNKSRGAPRFQKREVVLADEFETKVTVVKKPALLCNPVDKNGEGIHDPTTHLSCYEIKDARGQSKRGRSDVSVENQFGVETLRVGRPSILCAPSTKEGVPSALNLDHFKCYKATKAKGSARFQKRNLLLADQFETKLHEAKRPSHFCNAVDKDGEGIRDPAAHLECYDLKRISKRCVADTPPEQLHRRCKKEEDCDGVRRQTNRCQKQEKLEKRVVETEDQFGVFNREVRNPRIVCVPTRAEAATCAQQSTLTVISNPGSELDLGWTGITHDNETPSEASITIDLDCPDGENCTVGGLGLNDSFGGPLPVSAGNVPVCLVNRVRQAIQGEYTCANGCSSTDVLLESQVFLEADLAKPCPLCVGDDVLNDGVQNGTCNGGTTDGAPCDAGASDPNFGITSLDCLPTGNSVGELDINLSPATTGSISVDSSLDCVSPFFDPGLCYCPDQIQPNGCIDGVCTAITDAHGQPAGECQAGPIDGVCANARFRSCRLEQGAADCESLFPGAGTCIARTRPCFTTNISAEGECAAPGNEGTLVSFFCVPATRAAAVNTTWGIPGPGLVKLKTRSVRIPR